MLSLKNFLLKGKSVGCILELTANIHRHVPQIAAIKRLVVEQLPNRELLEVEGEEAVPFLQGLITNDMNQLKGDQTPGNEFRSIFAMFLNKAGRVLYDAFIYKSDKPNAYVIECDQSVSMDLRRHLRMYRVRRKIEVESLTNKYNTWVVFSPEGELDKLSLPDGILSTPDPRLRELGIRVIATPDKGRKELIKHVSDVTDCKVLSPLKNCNYRLHRYQYGVPEGSTDLVPGKNLPLEVNLDYLNGVSFHKGCYIGQELTARVHHTGVIRKRVVPLHLSAPVKSEKAEVRLMNGTKVGTVIGSVENRALALLRLEPAFSVPKLDIEGDLCYPEKPKWWPLEFPKKASVNE